MARGEVNSLASAHSFSSYGRWTTKGVSNPLGTPQNLPAVQALIWDIDGIFVDTEALHFQAWQKLLADFGKTLSLEEYQPMIGRGSTENMAEMCARKGISGDHQELNLRRRAYYGEIRSHGIPVLKDNVALMREFAQQYPQLIHVAASNSIASDVTENLAAAGLTNVFRFTVSGKERPDIRRKPAPDIYHLALERLGLPANACLAFEDTESGVTAAKAAGVRCVALPDALTAGQNFSAADFVIPPNTPRQPRWIMEQIT